MLPTLLLSLSLAALASAQDIVYDSIHNGTVLPGVWSTGFGLVQTGPQFVNVTSKTFYPPSVAGSSYSFTEDGFFEQVEYTFGANPAKPSCPNATLLFQHGTYELVSNGSIILTPFAPDGLVQTQSPCAAKSSTIQQFNATILISSWRIFIDGPTGAAHLHLFRFDGAPYNKQILRYTDPVPYMQATTQIVVVTPTAPSRMMVRRNAAPPNRLGAAGAVLGVLAAFTFGLFSVLR